MVVYIWLWLHNTEAAMRFTWGMGNALWRLMKGFSRIVFFLVTGIANAFGNIVSSLFNKRRR